MTSTYGEEMRLDRLEDDEVREIHARLSEFVRKHMVSSNSPAAKLQPYSECKPFAYAKALEARIDGLNDFRLSGAHSKALEQYVQGAEFSMPRDANGHVKSINLIAKIVQVRSTAARKRGAAKHGGSVTERVPSFTRAGIYLLLDVACLLGVWLQWR